LGQISGSLERAKTVLHGEIVWHDSDMANRSQKTARLCKSRKSFVLSEQVLDFIEKEKTRRGSESISAVLEDVIREYCRRYDEKTMSAAIANYYDSLSDEEQQEDRSWENLLNRSAF
jgi:Zn-dependent M32 family carboxypeptidase